MWRLTASRGSSKLSFTTYYSYKLVISLGTRVHIVLRTTISKVIVSRIKYVDVTHLLYLYTMYVYSE